MKADYEITPIQDPNRQADMKSVATQSGSVRIPKMNEFQFYWFVYKFLET
ncbi:UNVERIFIED_ORG: hypothetical protein [Escherichia phage CMSTMSU]